MAFRKVGAAPPWDLGWGISNVSHSGSQLGPEYQMGWLAGLHSGPESPVSRAASLLASLFSWHPLVPRSNLNSSIPTDSEAVGSCPAQQAAGATFPAMCIQVCAPKAVPVSQGHVLGIVLVSGRPAAGILFVLLLFIFVGDATASVHFQGLI